ncbi:dual specificity protein phosphatase 13 isoform X2 [Heterocephalus glaber]|uniref:Dual specificity protein phosphatase 13 isoform X2 n=1 Tax=Heterocephalus glaber TaxID=10181 RepID=A0AAX6T0I7_HETGA|nr:dual specificity protein phosphatase 13 isoform X2 [Heterocephalus glaber]
MAEASLPELGGDTEATPCPSVLELEELLRAGKASCSRVDEVWPNLFIGDAQGPGALRGGREPLGHAGPGLPHAAPAAVPAPGRACRAGAAMDLPQPRLPPPTPPAGPATWGCKPQLRGRKQHQVCRDLWLAAGGTSCVLEKTSARAGHPHRMDSLQKQDLRRPKIHGARRVSSPYQPPTLGSLQRLLWVRRATTLNHVNEVWPNLFLGDAYAARDRSRLMQMGITHVVNAAAGRFQVDTGAKFYHGLPLEYYGVEADDNPNFDISIYFLPVARYIRAALSVPRGRVLVHCAMGVSRSATLVLAFLMICENMTLVEAIQTVQAHRDICPNSGFLRQLQVLDNRLGWETEQL